MKKEKNGNYVTMRFLLCAAFALPCNSLSGATAPEPGSIRAYMIRYYQDESREFSAYAYEKILGDVTITNFNGCPGQNLHASQGISREAPINHFHYKADRWKAWNPPFRFMSYMLDFDWNDAKHRKELQLYILKYTALGFSLWYLISIMKHYFNRQRKQHELEQLILLIKTIEATHNQDVKAAEAIPTSAVAKL